MARIPLKRGDVRHGLRVAMVDPRGLRHLGMLTGKLDTAPPKLRVEVMPEGASTGKLETWLIDAVERLPAKQQLRIHGGQFDPPIGWPMIASPSSNRQR